MTLIALCSAKGSPGVTTAGLALALTWPRPVLLVEADPAGGSILPGYLAARAGGDLLERGLLAAATGLAAGDVWAIHNNLIDLDPPGARRLLLLGLTDAVQASAVEPVWANMAAALAQLRVGGEAVDVIVDCGRLVAPAAPWPVLAAADRVLLALEPTMPAVTAAWPAARRLEGLLGGSDRLAALLIGPGPHSVGECGRALETAVAADLPWDMKAAAALGGTGRVKASLPLLRAAAATGRDLAAIRPAAPALTAGGTP